MRDLLTLLSVGCASALVPVVNIETYLGVRAAVAEMDAVWLMALVAAFGQIAGKLVWYYLGATSLSWSWVRRKLEKPRAKARLTHWQRRTHDRPFFAGAVVLVSAVTGFPPFAILSVVAGQLRMNLWLFVGIGLVGRWVRFMAVLGGVGWLDRAGVL